MIPSHQIDPPAGHEKEIAHRPACPQLEPRSNSNGNIEWGVIKPKTGEFYVLGTRPPMPTDRAHASLDSSGLCKVGGVFVPIRSPREAIASIRQTVDLVPVQSTPKWHQYGVWGIAIVVFIAGVAYSQWQVKQEREAFFK